MTQAAFSTTVDGPANAAPSTGVISFAVSVAAAQMDQVQRRFDLSALSTLPASTQLRIVTDSAPVTAARGTTTDPGTTAAEPLAPPFDVRLIAFDTAAGMPGDLPSTFADSIVEVWLPLPIAELAPGEEVAWLMELVGPSGEFLGFARPPTRLDVASQQLVLEVRADQLRGTLFLPVIWRTTYMRNFDPGVHIWSSPFADAVDFGVAAPQWTRMQILAPQIGRRLLVLNAFTGQPGWVETTGVGLVANDDGLPAVPAINAAVESPTPDAPLQDAPAASVGAAGVYTVQPGDSLRLLPRRSTARSSTCGRQIQTSTRTVW